MPFCSLQKNCKFRTNLRSGSSIIATKPVFTYNTKFIFISNGNHIKVYSIDSGECIHTLKPNHGKIVSLQVNPSNFLQLYSCSENGEVVLWDQIEGALLETIVINTENPIISFYAPSHSNWFVITEAKKTATTLGIEYALYSCLISSEPERKIVNFEPIIQPVLPIENAVAYGCQNKVIASVHENVINLYEIEEKRFHKQHSDGKPLHCIAVHPSEYVFAVGDASGKIVVWSNIFDQRKAIRSLYHWHASAIADLIFSSEGHYLYSGGEEAALVKWNLDSDEKHVLPRLGAPICKLAISSDNAYILTTHLDNTVQVISSERRVVQVIQGLGRGLTDGTYLKHRTTVSCGLLYDRISKALVMNGGPGQLQFFNAQEDKKLFSLDISGRNVISGTKFYTDIQKAAFNDKCNWLATVEYWSDEKASPQIWLKFWEYKDTKQMYVLNTNYFLPHYKDVNCVVFQPETSLAITTSSEGKFKVWSLLLDPKFPDKETWGNISNGYYRDLPAGDACFSEDGSLLAVAFEDIITLWTVPNTVLKFVLFNEKNQRNIKQLVFGRKECKHLLVSQDGVYVTIWNILSLSIIGRIRTEVQVIVPDMDSCFMACFSVDRAPISTFESDKFSVYLFRPDSEEPLHYVENVVNQQFAAGIFVPQKGTDGKTKSQLVFIDVHQNVYTLTDEDDNLEGQDISEVSVKQNIPVTPFGMLQAEKRVSSVVKQEAELFVDNNVGEKDFIEVSNPTYVDLEDMCSKYLKLMLFPIKNKDENEMLTEEMQVDKNSDVDEDESIIFD